MMIPLFGILGHSSSVKADAVPSRIFKGTTVEGSHEAREGKHVATQIQVVMRTREGEKSPAPAESQ